MYKYLILFLLSFCVVYGQSDNTGEFFKELIAGSKDLSEYVPPGELSKSQRLNISYENIQNKFLISYDIDEKVKQQLRSGAFQYELIKESLNNNYLKVTFSVPGLKYEKDFYFHNGRLISPVTYHTLNWRMYKSKYFTIYVSDTTLLNRYSVELLDGYVISMLELLQVDSTDRSLLEKEKIIYVLCKDQEEIKTITGFDTRGLYILAYDEVVTTFNCHFHELSHLMINYKLKTLPLYTLPFFQEGFAAATGGRGGIRRNIILDTGHYLHSSGITPFNSILTHKEFLAEDASVSYPVAALYTSYLLNSFGVNSFLKLYRDYSGSFSKVSSLSSEMITLPPVEDFEKFVINYQRRGGITIENDEQFTTFYDGNYLIMSESDNYYKFSVQKNFSIKEAEAPGYRSKKFAELFPGTRYQGEKYAVTVSEAEININNLYTNILMATYYAGFSGNFRQVPSENGFFTFYVEKDIFEEDLKTLEINIH
jgi:hypothetical protein